MDPSTHVVRSARLNHRIADLRTQLISDVTSVGMYSIMYHVLLCVHTHSAHKAHHHQFSLLLLV